MKILSLLILITFISVSCQQESTIKGPTAAKKINVAIFSGNGAGAVSVIETIEALNIDSGINAEAITAFQIQEGKLKDFDAIIFPGGSGSKELNNLGESGKQIVIDFIKKQGKGVVGICAGGYLLSSTQGYPNMGLASSIHIDRNHYNRGRGLVEFALTKEGKNIFPELLNHSLFLQYYDGPVLTEADSSLSTYNEIAIFVSDIHPDDFAPRGITPGKTFFLNQEVGKGRLFITAGHPESTPGMRWIIPRMVRWVCRTQIIDYSAKWVRPQINDSAIFFTRELGKYEKSNFWNLFSDSSSIQIQAMDNLYKIRSRPAVRWNIGLLRSKNSNTRKHAALLLRETEYSFAIPDLQTAIKKETNEEVKSEMQKSLEYLSY